MKSKTKTIIYTVLMCVVMTAFSYFYAHIDKNIYLYDRNADTATFQSTGIVTNGEKITQTFVSEENTIDGINVKLFLTGNVEDVVLYYALKDTQTGDVVENEVAATELVNNRFNQLEVRKLTQTEGKEYELILCAENADEENGIGFYKTAEDVLVARMICHRFDVETFIVSMTIIIFVYAFMKGLYKAFR